SPFWDAVGKRFMPLEFPEADRKSAVNGMGWVHDMMPREPIIANLLPTDAQRVIGKPHDTSAIAMAMLEKEGFRFDGYVDIFDAGPQVIAERKSIATIANSIREPFVAHSLRGDETEYLAANLSLRDFRVIRTAATVETDAIKIPEEAYAALGCQDGDEIIVSPW
ncbi:MAG: arginine N-succinyltransferase, partial [Shewanella sp.]